MADRTSLFPPSPTLSFLLLALTLSIQSTLCSGSKLSPEIRLKKELMKDYDSEIRPIYNSTDHIQLFVTFYLDYIVNIDEKNEIFSLKGSIFQQWTDEILTWDPSKHEGIKHLVLKSTSIWTPPLMVINAVNAFTMVSQLLRIDYTGNTYMKSTDVYTTHCRIKVSHFPFDTQVCEIVFSTLADIENRVCINVHPENAYNMSHFSIHDGWRLLKVEAKMNEKVSSDVCASKIYFFFTIQRNYLYYMLVVISPLLLMYFCTTLVFLIPVDSGEKISFSNVLILSFAVFMNSFSSILPHSAGQVSILAVFVILYVIQCILTFMLSCFITRVRHCHRNPFTFPFGLGGFLQRIHSSNNEKNKRATLVSFVNMTRSLFLPLLKNTGKSDVPEIVAGVHESNINDKPRITDSLEIRRQLCDILDYYLFYVSCVIVFLEILITFCFFTVMSETF
ncbi:neuronal acetylcholine receptor subunit alpha-6-like [Octopus vulgaris]|uniref:Neuronal acetylcholine receptor subunit alpha-6-like n=1 Tax=Octopus vulgaris TaxID=6645 RepID=A0AA36BW03_OCTVU|nr:neuronal acetylcholine receptor subunit alpha-6-like [Octopus vulgaris]